MTSSGPSDEIRERFQSIYETSGKPSSMAVFALFDSEGRPQCQVTAFFSPACADLAREMGARPCNPPSRSGLSLLAGSESAWTALFL